MTLSAAASEHDLPANPAEAWPDPSTILNAGGASDWLLICEHASSYIPGEFRRLGLPEHQCRAHVAWDPGAAELTRALSAALDAEAVLANYSRLLVDLNRPLDRISLIPERSEDIDIPGNQDLSAAQRAERVERIHRPFHHSLAALLDRRRAEGRRTRLVAVHSFTPVYLGVARPWHLGVLSGNSRGLAAEFVRLTKIYAPDLCVTLDEPYAVGDGEDYAIPVHGDARGLDALLLELRNDTLAAPAAIEAWSRVLARVMAEI